HPAVAAEALARFDSAPSDAALDPSPLQVRAAVPAVVGLVGMKLLGPPPRSAARTLDGRDRIDQLLEDEVVVRVGGRQLDSERNARPLDRHVALGAGFAPVRRVGPRLGAPILAATLALSSAARLQSIRSARPRRLRISWWILSHTPASFQSRRRRQQVMNRPEFIGGLVTCVARVVACLPSRASMPPHTRPAEYRRSAPGGGGD